MAVDDNSVDGVSATHDPRSVTLTLAGREVVVRPLKLRQMVPFAQSGGAVILALVGAPPASVDDWVALVSQRGRQLCDGAAIACDLEPDFINELDLGSLIPLCTAIAEVNVDFFVQILASSSEAIVRVTTKIQATREVLSRSSTRSLPH